VQPPALCTQYNARNKWLTTQLESVRGHGQRQTSHLHARTRTSGDASTRRNASHCTPTQDAAQRQNHTPPTATLCAAAWMAAASATSVI